MSERRTIGWKLDRRERATLLARFPPRWPDVVADHVTLASRVGSERPLPSAATGEIVGIADDSAGVQALVARIGGTIDRPGGGSWHVTWSLDHAAGRRAVESNDVIARFGWTAVEPPVPLTLIPAVLRRYSLSAASS